MATYTNLGLVQHAKKLLAANTKYMWGGIARPITPTYVDMLAKYYPEQYSASRKATLKSLKGYYGVDCVGTIKSYYWSGNDNGGFGSPKYDPATDVNANVMYARATEKGAISTIPEIPGLVVYCKSHPHVGVYIGNGEVIESTIKTAGDGVIKTKLKDWKWEYWFKCPYIQYISENPAEKKLAVGSKVQLLKTADKYAGSSISIPDGVKGKTYTVQQLKSDRVLLKEIYSWVYVKDVKVI